MKYFEELDAWLTAVLLVTDEDADEEAWSARVKKQLKDRILESYRNGQKAGKPDKTTAAGSKVAADAPRQKWRRFNGR